MEAIRAPHAFDGSQFRGGGATVLVDDGSIVAVLPYAAEVPDGTIAHDHPGATVLPGLIDSHTHLVGDSRLRALERLPSYTDDELEDVISTALARQLSAGVTTVRDLGDRGYLAVQRRDRARASAPSTPEPTTCAPRSRPRIRVGYRSPPTPTRCSRASTRWRRASTPSSTARASPAEAWPSIPR